jgi:cytochrome b561
MANVDPKPAGYDPIHRALHWILTVLVAGQFIAGLTMPDVTSIDRVEGAWLWHLALGPTILFFAILQLIWRIMRPVPIPFDLPKWQRTAARAVHDTIILLLIVLPLLGWAAASSQGMDVKLFGFITLPPLAAKQTPWADTAGDIHMALVYVLLVLIVLHVAAALHHYFIRRDRVMQRMIFGA